MMYVYRNRGCNNCDKTCKIRKLNYWDSKCFLEYEKLRMNR